MKYPRCIGALLVALLLLGALGVSEASAFGRRAMPAPGVYYYDYPGAVYPYWSYPYYVAPLPAYGILPPPVTSVYGYGTNYGAYRTAEDYGYMRDRFETPPRMRLSMYPAVPFEASPATERRRARFEVKVPVADAIVYFDGVQTQQTGLNRVFVTPALDEGKEYTITIMVRWPTEDGSLSAPRQKSFTVTAGQTIQTTFIVQ